MKKLLALLPLCLLLTACSGNSGETEPPTLPPEGQGLYISDSPVEQQTGGAVRAYSLDGIACTGLTSMGNKLLLGTEASLTVLQGDTCQIGATLETEQAITFEEASFCAAETGMAYYEKETDQVVRLNPQLQESARYTLPADMQGEPAISLGSQEIYCCTGQELRAVSMQTGISRLIRNHSYPSLELTAVLFDGKVLLCRTGDGQTLYLSTQTGQTLSQDQALTGLQTYQDAFFVQRRDGHVTQRIFGTLDGTPQSLNVDTGRLTAALPLNGVLSYVAGEDGLQISFYALDTGLRTAAVTLEGISDPVLWSADEQYVWIVAYENDKQTLYRWDVTMSAVQEETVHTGPLYSYENPDTEGLAQLQSRVDAINQTYGVSIQLWQDAISQTGGYTMTAEHQVAPITALLDELEEVLKLFPEGFMAQTVEGGSVRVCLVRRIEGQDYVQYWADGNCNIAISLDADVKTAFVQSVVNGIQTHILGNSRDFDDWNDLNPEGFTYGHSAQDASWIEGDDRAFVDLESMENPYVDRSRILAYAILEENGELFQSETMQKKLLQICKGIREAYGLEKNPDTYLWEQYLNQSLAYTK